MKTSLVDFTRHFAHTTEAVFTYRKLMKVEASYKNREILLLHKANAIVNTTNSRRDEKIDGYTADRRRRWG